MAIGSLWSLVFGIMAAAKVGCKSSCTRSKYQADQGKLPRTETRAWSNWHLSLKNYATSNGVPRIISSGKNILQWSELQWCSKQHTKRSQEIPSEWRTCNCDSKVCLLEHCQCSSVSLAKNSLASDGSVQVIVAIQSWPVLLDTDNKIIKSMSLQRASSIMLGIAWRQNTPAIYIQFL